MANINWSDNVRQAAAACERYEQIGRKSLLGTRYDRMTLLMDLTAADGVNGNLPIDWPLLLRAPDADFLHDVCGITNHMNRTTGQLGGCFVPRSVMQTVSA